MNKTLLIAFALGGALLTACSSEPSDFRASKKVSLDTVPPGTRSTDISNLNGANPPAAAEGEHEGHEMTHERTDVMPNHDELKNDVGGTEQVPASEKTTNADSVENHN